MSRGDHRQLDPGVLQQLLDPVLLRGPASPTRSTRYRVRSRSRRIGCRRHETGPQHLPLGDLAQPHRVQPVGLRPARQVLDVLGVDQPRLEPGRLQQVERRLPVVAGRLHHHPGHPQVRAAGRPSPAATGSSSSRCVTSCTRARPDPAPGTRTQHTSSALPMSNAATRSMISSSSCDLLQHLHTSLDHSRTTGPAARGSRRDGANLTPRARSNNEGPTAQLPRPTR